VSWLLLFVAPLLAYQPPRIAVLAFSPQFLLVPLAAFLGRRFRGLGVLAIAIGGLPFMITIYSPLGLVGGSPAVYFIALAAAAIAASPRPFLECFRFPAGERSAWWLAFASPFLLVLYAGAAFVMEPALQVSWTFGFALIGYALVFALGVRGARFAPLLAGLAACALASWAVAYLLVSVPRGSPEIRIAALQPSMVLTALAMYTAGKASAAFLKGEAPGVCWRRPWLTVALLVVFLWFGPPPIAGIQIGLPFAPRLSIFQVAAALPLAGFMAGLLTGAHGTLFVTAFVVLVLIAWMIVGLAVGYSVNPHFAMGVIPLDAPFVAAAFALMGAKVAEARAGR
jgi:hypothetical protein